MKEVNMNRHPAISDYQRLVPQYLQYWTDFRRKATQNLATNLPNDQRHTWEALLQEANQQCEKYARC